MICNNDSVTFSGNSAFGSSSSDDYASVAGGAIYVHGDLHICNNGSVIFEKNAAVGKGTYLESIYVYGGRDGEIALSASSGKSIEFRDSVSIYGGATVNLNADYTDAEGNTIKQKGDILFTGAYTESHLNEILKTAEQGRTATEEEILLSRTSEVLAMTNLYGGRLRVEDGAIYQGRGITAMAGSGVTVRVKDAMLNHRGYDLTFNAGTTLELVGQNSITANTLTMHGGASLNVNLTDEHLETAALTLTGTLNTAGLTINLGFDGEASGWYQIINLSSADDYLTPEEWTLENVTICGTGNAANATFSDLIWQDGSLYYAVGTWNNAEGNRIWSYSALNWTGNIRFKNGADVTFPDMGAGEVILMGDLAPSCVTVQNCAGNDYMFTAVAGGGKLAGEARILKKGDGELTISTANEHTGDTVLQEGAINVHHSTALGATAGGYASVISAADTILRVGNDSKLVLAGDKNSIAGAVEIASDSTQEMKSGGYAASNSTVNGTLAFNGVSAVTAGSLSGTGTVQVTDSVVNFSSQNSFAGNMEVRGKNASLNIASGNYAGAGQISVCGGTLTFGAAADLTLNSGGSLNMSALDESPAELVLRNINIKGGATLASLAELESAVSLSTEEITLGVAPASVNENVGAVLNCSRLTLNVDSELHLENAHFDLSGGTLTLAVPKNTSSRIELVLASGVVYAESTQVFLFSNLGTINFIYDGITARAGDGVIRCLNASDYFSGSGITNYTELVYDSGQNVLFLQGIGAVPEPTSSTLSLLALASLAARRRRKA